MPDESPAVVAGQREDRTPVEDTRDLPSRIAELLPTRGFLDWQLDNTLAKRLQYASTDEMRAAMKALTPKGGGETSKWVGQTRLYRELGGQIAPFGANM